MTFLIHRTVERRWALNKRAASRYGSGKRVLLVPLRVALVSDESIPGDTRNPALDWRRSRPQEPAGYL